MKLSTTTLLILIFTAFQSIAYGQAINFDGTDDYAQVPSSNNGDILGDYSAPHDFTVEVRFRLIGTVINTRIAASNSEDAGMSGISFETDNSGQIVIVYGTQYGWSKINTGVIASTNTWYNAALTYNSTTYNGTGYLDGISYGLGSITGDLCAEFLPPASDCGYRHDGTYRFTLGGTVYYSHLSTVDIDYFRVWNTERSTTEIANNHNAEVSCNASGLILQYTINDGTAGANNMGVTTLADCVNGYHATLNNMDLTGASSNFVNPTGALLPVELTAFQGFAEKNSNLLNWSTAAEESNEGFYLERSPNGNTWDVIGFVRGNGTTYETQYYHYEDVSPYNGKNYYRLKQMDLDGQFEYSEVISVYFGGERDQVGQFYPNPSQSGLVNLDYFAQNDDPITVTVFDLAGTLVDQQIQSMASGNNKLSLDFSDLKTGIYIVEFGDDRAPTHRKLIIER